jgi:hypothetical protein
MKTAEGQIKKFRQSIQSPIKHFLPWSGLCSVTWLLDTIHLALLICSTKRWFVGCFVPSQAHFIDSYASVINTIDPNTTHTIWWYIQCLRSNLAWSFSISCDLSSTLYPAMMAYQSKDNQHIFFTEHSMSTIDRSNNSTINQWFSKCNCLYPYKTERSEGGGVFRTWYFLTTLFFLDRSCFCCISGMEESFRNGMVNKW